MPDQLTPYEGTAPYVFVSFEDSELAEPVIRRLIKMGYRTSFPPIIGDKVLFDADRSRRRSKDAGSSWCSARRAPSALPM